MPSKKKKQSSLFKKEVIKLVNDLSVSFEEFSKLSLDNTSDKKLKDSFENIRGIIFVGISEIKKNIIILSKTAEWNKLNISFFGETNAGKSTIIESLLRGNGKSIGEGYKDFTKNVSSSSYRGICLMDMPGIEGREEKVINSIHKAVNLSHVVFYVIGTNKEVEDPTILKIQKLLKDNARVYSIINSRGKPSVYKYKKELRDKNSTIVEKRVKKKFSEILGGNYVGNIIVNGYLGFLTGENLKKTRFEQDQKKAISIFGEKSKIEEFSNIQEIHSTIERLKGNIENEIKISNTYKFLKTIEIFLVSIQKEKEYFDSFIKEVNGLTQKYMKDIDAIIIKYESLIKSKLESNLYKMKVDMKKMLSKSIDEDDSKESIKSKIENVKKTQSDHLNKEINILLSSMKDEIEGKIKEFKNRMSLKMKFLEFKGAFDLENVLKSLEISFNYVVGQLVDVGLSISGVVASFFVHPILGVLVGLVAVARKIWDWLVGDSDKRKQEAKKKALDKIESMVIEVAKKIKRDMELELQKVKKNSITPINQMEKSMKGIMDISQLLDEKILEILVSQSKLSLLLSKELLGKEIQFSFLDLQLSEAVFIGYEVTSEVKSHLKMLLRLNNICFFQSYDEWLNKVSYKDQSNVIIANNEFNFRAINALTVIRNNSINLNKLRKGL